MQIKETAKVYDAIIVGSGAVGGMATKILSEAGLKVALLEAGPFFDPKDPTTATQMKFPWFCHSCYEKFIYLPIPFLDPTIAIFTIYFINIPYIP